MELQQNGSAVTGTYTTSNGRIFNGTLSGRTLTGFWVQDSSAVYCGSAKDGSNFWGHIEFEFNEDFTSFTGEYQWCDADQNQFWDGTRING